MKIVSTGQQFHQVTNYFRNLNCSPGSNYQWKIVRLISDLGMQRTGWSENMPSQQSYR